MPPHGTRSGRSAPSRLAALLIGSLLAGSWLGDRAVAQSPAWSTLQVAQGVQANAVRGQGKLVTYDQGTTLHVFSSVTRRWHETTKTANATVRLFNDCAVIVEADGCRAFSSHTGQFRDLATAGAPQLRNPLANKNDSIVLVQDGADVHAFSAFTGTWTTRTLAPGFGADVQRHVAITHSGTKVAALSAFDNVWHEQESGGLPTTISADGTTAIADNADGTFAFSAHTRTWQLHEATTGMTFARGDDWSMWFDSQSLVAYSSLRGTFTDRAAAITSFAGSTDLYAMLRTQDRVLAYSAITADVLEIAQPGATIEFGAGSALLLRNKSVLGYSPLRQAVAERMVKSGASGAGTSVAYVTEPNGRTHAFSSLTATWTLAPAVTFGSTATQTTTSIALETANDCFAFSARTGQFVALGSPVVALASNPTSAPLLGYDANQLVAFDTDSDRWMTRPRTHGGAPVFAVWRTSGLAIDGSTAHGFGAQTGAWQEQTLAAGPLSLAANSEVAYVVQANQIAACSMLPEIVSYQQFPHFRRVQPRGTAITFAAAPPATAFAIAALAPPIAPVTVPGLGALLLDANVALLAPVLPSSNEPVVRLSWQLPASGILAGSTLASQLVVLPANGPSYLSQRATVQLW